MSLLATPPTANMSYVYESTYLMRVANGSFFNATISKIGTNLSSIFLNTYGFLCIKIPGNVSMSFIHHLSVNNSSFKITNSYTIANSGTPQRVLSTNPTQYYS